MRSKHTGHIVCITRIKKITFRLVSKMYAIWMWITVIEYVQWKLTCSLMSCNCCCNFCTSSNWILLTFVLVGLMGTFDGVAGTVLFIATPMPSLFMPMASSLSFLSSQAADTYNITFSIRLVSECSSPHNKYNNTEKLPSKWLLAHHSKPITAPFPRLTSGIAHTFSWYPRSFRTPPYGRMVWRIRWPVYLSTQDIRRFSRATISFRDRWDISSRAAHRCHNSLHDRMAVRTISNSIDHQLLHV